MVSIDQRSVHRRIQTDPQRVRFHNKLALGLTVATVLLLITLSVLYGEHPTALQRASGTSWYEKNSAVSEPTSSWGRFLEDVAGEDDDNGDGGDDDNGAAADDDDGNDDDFTDFSRFSCRYIYNKTPYQGYAQCRFAKTCNHGVGVWAPWIFCWHRLSVFTLFLVLSPVMLLWMIMLFRLLGSTAEDYFSPSLEMFSVKLGLPPRFAGVSLLALGNGAADVSATMSAISNDPENGYKLSLGALSGAAMMVGGVIAGIVVIVAEGVPCRGALVRDVLALAITVWVVWSNLASGEIGPSATSLFLSLYALFVCLVLAADVYHRAVVLPRLAAIENPGGGGGDDAEEPLAQPATPSEVGAPSTFTRVITAVSNYDNGACFDDPQPSSDDMSETGPQQALNRDAPIILHGRHGILHGDGQGVTPTQTIPEGDEGGMYSLVEDHIDQVCVAEGAPGYSVHNWTNAFVEGKNEIIEHFTKCWEDIVWNGDLNPVEKFLSICEFPFTVMRKSSVTIPCEGFYNKGLIALSMAVSPLWFAFYIYSGHKINLLAKGSIGFFLIFWALTMFIACLILRHAPGGEGFMPMPVATPLALYGFIIAATWIDFVADHLVSLLDFIGIVMHIPGTIMGLTILAWGNSMADLSANITMARKGLANMAMTACFAGPIFNILVGLGLGFSSLAARSGNPVASVSLSAPVVAGFVFIILNCCAVLGTGICLGRGRIEAYYGYIAVGLYALYIAVSLTIQYTGHGDE